MEATLGTFRAVEPEMSSQVGMNRNPQGLHKASPPRDTGSRFTERGEPLRLPRETLWAKGVFVVVWGLGTTGLAPVRRKARVHPMSGAKPRCRTPAPTTEFSFGRELQRASKKSFAR